MYYYYLNFLSCTNSYLKISDAYGSQKYCGSISNFIDYAFVSCSRQVDIIYVTSGSQSPEYRGFRSYFERNINGLIHLKKQKQTLLTLFHFY